MFTINKKSLWLSQVYYFYPQTYVSTRDLPKYSFNSINLWNWVSVSAGAIVKVWVHVSNIPSCCVHKGKYNKIQTKFEILFILKKKSYKIWFRACCRILEVVYEHCIYVGVSNKVFTHKCQRIGDCMEFFIPRFSCICLLCPTRMKGYLTREGMKFRFYY